MNEDWTRRRFLVTGGTVAAGAAAITVGVPLVGRLRTETRVTGVREAGGLDPEIILRGPTIFDGSGGPPRRADVAIAGERIVAVGDLSTVATGEAFDVTGLCVCPGFIDVHTHTDLLAFFPDEHVDLKLASLRQGVTTEITGNCGFSAFPSRRDGGDDPYLGVFSVAGRRSFPTLVQYRDAFGERRPAVNVAPLLGHGTLRASVMGRENRPPSPDELSDMRRVLSQAMDEGAFGLSSGLVYPPGVFATTTELVDLAREVARYRRLYTSHMRDEGDRVVAAVEEALGVARVARVAVEISHHKVSGRRNWGRSQDTLSLIERARASGIDAAIDVYPYTAASTFLAATLPPWVLAGGPQAMADRLADDVALDRVRRDLIAGNPGWQNIVDLIGWENVAIAGDPPYAGHSVHDLAKSEGMDEVALVARLLQTNPGTIVLLHAMNEEEVISIGDQPFATVGSDGIPVPGRSHPRFAGTFARMLRRHAAEDRRLSDAIERMTSLPAGRFAVPGRGSVAPGMIADLVLFDRETVADRATYLEPLLPPTGITHVLVAGRFAVRDGQVIASDLGRVLEPA